MHIFKNDGTINVVIKTTRTIPAVKSLD